jgi:hypothetical protein
MPSIWVVTCSHCGTTGTIARPPSSPDFLEQVQCNSCGKQTSAKRGTSRYIQPRNKREEELDLLEVE